MLRRVTLKRSSCSWGLLLGGSARFKCLEGSTDEAIRLGIWLHKSRFVLYSAVGGAGTRLNAFRSVGLCARCSLMAVRGDPCAMLCPELRRLSFRFVYAADLFMAAHKHRCIEQSLEQI